MARWKHLQWCFRFWVHDGAKPTPVCSQNCFVCINRIISNGGWQIHVEVVAMVTRPEAVASDVTNTFHFSYRVDGCRPLKRVLPATADEAISIRSFCAGEQ